MPLITVMAKLNFQQICCEIIHSKLYLF